MVVYKPSKDFEKYSVVLSLYSCVYQDIVDIDKYSYIEEVVENVLEYRLERY